MNTALNRTVILQLTNKSGISVSKGDIVIIDTSNDNSFTTTTTLGDTSSTIGVVVEPFGISSNSVGGIATQGWVPKINLVSSADSGDFIKASTTIKKGISATTGDSGIFAQVLEAGTSPSAILSSISTAGTPITVVVTEPIYARTLTADTVIGNITLPSGYDSIELEATLKIASPVGAYGHWFPYLNNDTNDDHYTTMEIDTYSTSVFANYYEPGSSASISVITAAPIYSGYYNFVKVQLPDVTSNYNYKQLVADSYLVDFTGGVKYQKSYQVWSGGSNTHINSIQISTSLASGSAIKITGRRTRDILTVQ